MLSFVALVAFIDFFSPNFIRQKTHGVILTYTNGYQLGCKSLSRGFFAPCRINFCTLVSYAVRYVFIVDVQFFMKIYAAHASQSVLTAYLGHARDPTGSGSYQTTSAISSRFTKATKPMSNKRLLVVALVPWYVVLILVHHNVSVDAFIKVDTKVRRVLETNACAISWPALSVQGQIDNSSSKSPTQLDRILYQVATAFRLAPKLLKVRFYKLLLYQPGDFFLPHFDRYLRLCYPVLLSLFTSSFV